MSRMWKDHTVECVYETQPAVKPVFQVPRQVREDMFRAAQKKDHCLSQVFEILQGSPKDTHTSEAKKLAKQCDYNEFTGCLYYFKDVTSKLVVPGALRKMVITEAHDSVTGGHQGIAKTLDKILQKFWWPTVRDDVQSHVASCAGCAARNPGILEIQRILCTR